MTRRTLLAIASTPLNLPMGKRLNEFATEYNKYVRLLGDEMTLDVRAMERQWKRVMSAWDKLSQ